MLTESQLRQFDETGLLPLGKVAPDDLFAAMQQRLDDLAQGRVPNDDFHFQLEAKYREAAGTVVGATTTASSGEGKAAEHAATVHAMGMGAGASSPNKWQGPSPHYRKIAALDRDPIFFEYLCRPGFRAIYRQLVGPAIAIHRAMALLKPAFDGSPLGWHQDAGDGFPVARGRFFTIWTAVDDADLDNGGLLVLPGTHRLPALDGPWTDVMRRSREYAATIQGQAVPLTARAGEAYLLHNFLLHSSGPNPTPRRRRAFTFIFVDANVPVQGKAPDHHRSFTRIPMD